MDPNLDIVRRATCGESCDMKPVVVSARKELCRSEEKGMASARSREHRGRSILRGARRESR
jgi:hypothetical protein